MKLVCFAHIWLYFDCFIVFFLCWSCGQENQNSKNADDDEMRKKTSWKNQLHKDDMHHNVNKSMCEMKQM